MAAYICENCNLSQNHDFKRIHLTSSTPQMKELSPHPRLQIVKNAIVQLTIIFK